MAPSDGWFVAIMQHHRAALATHCGSRKSYARDLIRRIWRHIVVAVIFYRLPKCLSFSFFHRVCTLWKLARRATRHNDSRSSSADCTIACLAKEAKKHTKIFIKKSRRNTCTHTRRRWMMVPFIDTFMSRRARVLLMRRRYAVEERFFII